MENIFLSEDEITLMTRRSRYRHQAQALDQLGVTYRLRQDGSPLVLRAHVQDLLGAHKPVLRVAQVPVDSIDAVNARILRFRHREKPANDG